MVILQKTKDKVTIEAMKNVLASLGIAEENALYAFNSKKKGRKFVRLLGISSRHLGWTYLTRYWLSNYRTEVNDAENNNSSALSETQTTGHSSQFSQVVSDLPELNLSQILADKTLSDLSALNVAALGNDNDSEALSVVSETESDEEQTVFDALPAHQQVGHGSMVPISVMVPVGNLKRDGQHRSARKDKNVIFSDGIRPGCDLAGPSKNRVQTPTGKRFIH